MLQPTGWRVDFPAACLSCTAVPGTRLCAAGRQAGCGAAPAGSDLARPPSRRHVVNNEDMVVKSGKVGLSRRGRSSTRIACGAPSLLHYFPASTVWCLPSASPQLRTSRPPTSRGPFICPSSSLCCTSGRATVCWSTLWGTWWCAPRTQSRSSARCPAVSSGMRASRPSQPGAPPPA